MKGCQKNMKSVLLALLQSHKKHGIQHRAQKTREKIQALSLAKECYSMKMDLLTNATVVDDAIRFVSSNKSREKQKSSLDNSNQDDKNSSSGRISWYIYRSVIPFIHREKYLIFHLREQVTLKHYRCIKMVTEIEM